MKDDAFKATVAAPLYLIESFEPCWKCHSEQRVIVLASRRVRTDDFDELDADDTAEPFLLTNITKMPQQISEHLSTAFPQFQERHSKTADLTYYANTCQRCGANFGDHYLFSEPDGAFFPQSEEQAQRTAIRKLPFEGTFEFVCAWSQGLGGFIFEHAKQHKEA